MNPDLESDASKISPENRSGFTDITAIFPVRLKPRPSLESPDMPEISARQEIFSGKGEYLSTVSRCMSGSGDGRKETPIGPHTRPKNWRQSKKQPSELAVFPSKR